LPYTWRPARFGEKENNYYEWREDIQEWEGASQKILELTLMRDVTRD
jgi:hypothetical protein